MTFHALVIDDDQEILDDIQERLESMGHNCDTASCQKSARERIKSDGYSYVLLDLEIPVRYGRKPRIQNGRNLLKEIREIKGLETIPVIIMTAHGLDGPDLAVEVMRDGNATDFVRKPFPSQGETLEKKIELALNGSGRSRPGAAPVSTPVTTKEPAQPFEAGKMVFSPESVELCGVQVCRCVACGMIRRILDRLREQNENGRFKAYGGAMLADLIGCESGQNSVSGAVKGFRQTVSNRLLAEMNIKVGLKDVIETTSRGYRLTDMITVRDADGPVNGPDDTVSDPVNDPPNDLGHDPDDPLNGPANDPDEPALNERQEWIMEQLQDGVKLRADHIMEQFSCSNTTAKRDIKGLRQRGHISFEGTSRTGHYKLKP